MSSATDALFVLPANRRRRLVEALDVGVVSAPYKLFTLQATLGIPEGGEEVLSALQALEAMGFVGSTCAAWIRTIDEMGARTPRPDLVWSGPEVPGVHARDTRRVYEELLGSAISSVWVSTFAFFDGPKAFEVLSARMDATPALQATLLLNIQRRKGDSSPPAELVSRFAQRFWTHDWPGQRKPTVYYDPRSLEPDGPTGVLHAKAVVADEEAVFITSANFTEAAWDRNWELGLVVRDRALALTIARHLQTLIDRGLLSRLPGP